MKKIAIVILALEYLLYFFLFFGMLFPSVKLLISQSVDKSWALMGFAMILLPLLLGLFLFYKCYTAQSSSAFWIYFVLCLLLPILAVFVGMFFMM